MDEFAAAAAASALPALPDAESPVPVTDDNAGAVWCDHVEQPLPEPPQIDREQRQFTSLEQARDALGLRIDPVLRNVFAQPRIEQRSPDWYLARNEAITASDFGAASKFAEYGSQVEVFRKKVETGKRQFSKFAQECMAHGVKYEDAAAYAYEQATGNTILDFGLLSHWRLYEMRPANIEPRTWFSLIHQAHRPDIISEEDWATILELRWLKGSPDGITANGILIEIKCPRSPILPGKIKDMYYAQVQLNMEVAGVDRCHFIQYRPRESWLFGDVLDYFEVTRDGEWFEQRKPIARVVWDWVLHYRRTGALHSDLVSKIRHVDEDGDNENNKSSGEIAFVSTRKRRAPSSSSSSTSPPPPPPLKLAPTVGILPFADEDATWTESAAESMASASPASVNLGDSTGGAEEDNDVPVSEYYTARTPARVTAHIIATTDDDDDTEQPHAVVQEGTDITPPRSSSSPVAFEFDLSRVSHQEERHRQEHRPNNTPATATARENDDVTALGDGPVTFEFDLDKITSRASKDVVARVNDVVSSLLHPQ